MPLFGLTACSCPSEPWGPPVALGRRCGSASSGPDPLARAPQVVQVLKKEIVKTQNKDFEKGGEYRQMLVQVRVGSTQSFTQTLG